MSQRAITQTQIEELDDLAGRLGIDKEAAVREALGVTGVAALSWTQARALAVYWQVVLERVSEARSAAQTLPPEVTGTDRGADALVPDTPV